MCKLNEQRILFFARSMGIGGTENIILQMCKILNTRVEKIVVISCGGEKVEILGDMGIMHYEIPDIANKSPIVVVKVLRVLNTVIQKEKITIVHVHDRMAAFYVSISKLKGVRFFATFHMNYRDKKRLTNFAYKNAYIIACGSDVKKTLVNYYGFPEEKIDIIKNSITKIDSKNIIVDKTLDSLKKEGYYIVGNIGRLTDQKGMEYFIESYPIVKKQIKNVKYIIVGDGELMDLLKDKAKTLGCDNNILFLGYRNDVRNLMRQMDCIVLSSLWEGLPLTPIEAFSVSRTVIGTNIDGTNEIVIDNYNGLLVETKNSLQIANAVVKVLSNPDLKHELETNAYNTYLEEYSEDRFARELIEFYNTHF